MNTLFIAFARVRTGGLVLLVVYPDYGFIFKMKFTGVSNPVQRKQKETDDEFK